MGLILVFCFHGFVICWMFFSLNILDVIRIANYILTTSGFTDFQISLADMNIDGSINISDIILLIDIILGID